MKSGSSAWLGSAGQPVHRTQLSDAPSESHRRSKDASTRAQHRKICLSVHWKDQLSSASVQVDAEALSSLAKAHGRNNAWTHRSHCCPDRGNSATAMEASQEDAEWNQIENEDGRSGGASAAERPEDHLSEVVANAQQDDASEERSKADDRVHDVPQMGEDVCESGAQPAGSAQDPAAPKQGPGWTVGTTWSAIAGAVQQVRRLATLPCGETLIISGTFSALCIQCLLS
jgi:hypothetical protein